MTPIFFISSEDDLAHSREYAPPGSPLTNMDWLKEYDTYYIDK